MLYLIIRNERIYAFSENIDYVHSYLELYYSHKEHQKFEIKKTKKIEEIKKAKLEIFDLELVERIPGIVLPELEYEIFERGLKELYEKLREVGLSSINRYRDAYKNEPLYPDRLLQFEIKFYEKFETYETFLEKSSKLELIALTMNSDILRELYQLEKEYREKL